MNKEKYIIIKNKDRIEFKMNNQIFKYKLKKKKENFKQEKNQTVIIR